MARPGVMLAVATALALCSAVPLTMFYAMPECNPGPSDCWSAGMASLVLFVPAMAGMVAIAVSAYAAYRVAVRAPPTARPWAWTLAAAFAGLLLFAILLLLAQGLGAPFGDLAVQALHLEGAALAVLAAAAFLAWTATAITVATLALRGASRVPTLLSWLRSRRG